MNYQWKRWNKLQTKSYDAQLLLSVKNLKGQFVSNNIDKLNQLKCQYLIRC
ncbi:unnamed protein product [Paramecium sonneborni]|uniref:Uncharacterized protein n=1 Tax=Paramecium sonneborni TaxID=65129 RepID=A0A8S1R4C1_9CILI|nr:unnamed protein product [Paramecium sonneborni]